VADTENQQTPKPYVPPSMRVSELAEAFAAEGLVTPEAAQKVAEQEKQADAPPAPVEPPKAPEPVKAEPEELPAIAKIAKKQAEFRKEVEQNKPLLDILSRARNKQISPADALAALGFTHSEYVDSVLAKGNSAPAEESKVEPMPEVKQLKSEIEKLRAERDAEKATAARAQALDGIKGKLGKDDKFKHINALGEYERVEAVIIQHYNQYGELPGETFEESVSLAAEVVEKQLKAEASRWSKVLTTTETPATVQSKPPEPSASAGHVTTPRVLNNSNTTAPSAPVKRLLTKQERIQALAEGNLDALKD